MRVWCSVRHGVNDACFSMRHFKSLPEGAFQSNKSSHIKCDHKQHFTRVRTIFYCKSVVHMFITSF